MYRRALVNEIEYVMFWCDELKNDKQIESILKEYPEWSVRCIEI